MKRLIGGKAVHPIGLGCMNVCHAYGDPLSPAEAFRLFDQALELGYDHFDTARLYGAGRSEELLGEALAGRRSQVFLASKMGIFIEPERRWIDCRPETIRAELEKSLRALRTDHIDLYYMHRRDFSVPIEESVGAMADLIAEGKIGGIGLSEMSADTLRRAHATHPIAAMQSEYSPFARNVEIALLDTARELGVTLVAFSPLARAALCGTLRDPATLALNDIRRSFPRYQDDNWAHNLQLVDAFGAIAQELGVTAAQLALAWGLAKGEHVVTIPGTASLTHLAENIALGDWQPSAEVMARIDQLFVPGVIAGMRYPAGLQAQVETEEFA